MDDAHLTAMISELDANLPREGAFIRVAIPDVFESGEPLLAGNRAGYRRLGVELLKIADASPSADHPDRIAVDLAYLLDPDSQEGPVATFVRREGLRPRREEEQTGRTGHSWRSVALVALGLFLLAALVVGIVQIAKWILGSH